MRTEGIIGLAGIFVGMLLVLGGGSLAVKPYP
ncbi:Uncharacterised protein [Enterobacter asburiae]|uniref:Uncharacterized protein n=1 Tax=Enterobacter asburiae TaxID=61645 RepID=A0A376FHB2_ENTAS|nr:Uncharacterised protein [Enterobacter asburiae]